MNILMLGNGFDLYHKLPTTYQCFLETAHLISILPETPENIACMFIELKDKCEYINTSYTQYRDFYENYSFDETEKELIGDIKRLVQKNIWFNYFWSVYNKEATWIDFEREIALIVGIFSIVLNDRYSNNQYKDSLKSANDNVLIRKFGVFFERPIDNHILRFNEEYITKSLFGFNKYSVNKKKVFKKLFDELIDLSIALKLYLTVFVDNPLNEMHNQRVVKTNDVFCGYNVVVTFNYTNTYKTLYKKTSMHYIHGSLNDNIVLGINPDEKDELQKNGTATIDTSYIMFKKYYQRGLYRTDNSFIQMISNIREDRERIHPDRNSLVVCGHSLDSTDQDIIKDIFDISDNIYIVCHELSNIGNYITNLIRIYGKKEFDRIKKEKHLKFITYEEWNAITLQQEYISQLI